MDAAVVIAAGIVAIPGVETVLESIISQAWAMYELYRTRDKDRESFALFMRNVALTLEGVKGSVPQHAEPVVRDLETLVATATSRCEEYAARNASSSVIHLRSEAESLRSIMQDVQQLLPLLTISVASAANVAAAVANLQSRATSLQASSAEGAAHLSNLAATVTALAASSATSAEIEECMYTLKAGQMQLGETNTGLLAVLDGTAALQQQLADGVDSIVGYVDMLKGNFEAFSQTIQAMQEQMSSKVDMILELLMKRCGEAGSDAQSLQAAAGRVWSVIDQVIGSGDGSTLPESDRPEEWVNSIRQAIASGKLAISSCISLRVPLMSVGPLRPVTLPCCGFVVSHAGATQMLTAGKCDVCMFPLKAGAHFPNNEAVAAAVQAETNGFEPRVFKREDVIVNAGGQDKIGSGGEGSTVVKGTLRGYEAVAVKQVAVVDARDVMGVKQVVSASYIAGVASSYVCKLHGYCGTDTELWLIMELCDGNLTDLVRRVKRTRSSTGLPPVDTVALGLMLCSALDAVHHRAHCLHLDITPSNVLLTAPAASGEAGGEARGVRLSDFGLSKHLPSCVRSSLANTRPQSHVNGVAKGTPGYAPIEQLQRKAQRRSDVYSLGATLLYAATGAHPFGGESMEVIHFQLSQGNQMPIPDHVEPAALKDLITSMTAVDAHARPALADVQQRLQGMYDALRAEGEAASFVEPVAHVPASSATGHTPATSEPGHDSSTEADRSRAEQSTAGGEDETHVDTMSPLATQPAPSIGATLMASIYASSQPDHRPALDQSQDDGLEDVSGIRTVEGLFAHLDAGTPGRTFDFGGRTLHLTSSWKSTSDTVSLEGDEHVTVRAQLSQGDGIVSNVTLALSDAHHVMYLHSASKVKFRNVTVQGGVLECVGRQCHVELKDTTFEGCRLVAEEGATVHLHGGGLQALPPHTATDISLCVVKHENTTMHASSSVFYGEICVVSGARFTGNCVGVKLGSEHAYGILARGEHTLVTLEDSVVGAALHGAPAHRVGVLSEEAGAIKLTNCTVEAHSRGVAATGSANLCGCRIEAMQDGLWVAGKDAKVTATGCTFRGGTADVASFTDVAEGNITLVECVVRSRRTIQHPGTFERHRGGPRITSANWHTLAHTLARFLRR